MRRSLAISAEMLTIFLMVILVGVQLLGQPILLGYVETGSMEPTLNAGDGFVAIPSAVARDVQVGDVIVFEAQKIQGGGLTTHRVVKESERGYITRGDANPFTDQDTNEPPVKDAQVVAKAWQVGGSVVAIPHLGTFILGVQGALAGFQRWLAVSLGTRSFLGTQGIAYIILGLSALAYIGDILISDPSRLRRNRTRERDSGYSAHLILVGLSLLLVVSATAAMVAPAGPQQYGIVSAEFDSEDPTVIQQGQSSDIEYLVPNAGLVPVHVFLEPGSEGVDFESSHVYVGSRGEATATLTLHAPDDTGYYHRYLVEHRYLALLPESVITALYSTHQWLPIVVIDGMLGGGMYLIGWALIGSERVRVRGRESSGGSVITRLRDLLLGTK